jgi:hypothetical protein
MRATCPSRLISLLRNFLHPAVRSKCASQHTVLKRPQFHTHLLTSRLISGYGSYTYVHGGGYTTLLVARQRLPTASSERYRYANLPAYSIPCVFETEYVLSLPLYPHPRPLSRFLPAMASHWLCKPIPNVFRLGACYSSGICITL